MNLFEIIMLAFGLSMDAFAVAITIVLTLVLFNWRKALIVGLYFVTFQALMPVVGFFVGVWFADFVAVFSDIIAFVLLIGLGVKMIWGSLKKSDDDCMPDNEAGLGFMAMLPLAIATSIDAMAVGVGLAFLYVNILFAAAAIGVITLAVSAVGVKVGNLFGARFKNKAELAGGVILILIGVMVLWG